MKYCQNCGAQADDQLAFCQNCGQALPAEAAIMPPAVKKKKKGCLVAFLVVLGLLALTVLGAAVFMQGLFRPHDLGVAVTRDAYESAVEKIGYSDNRLSVSGDLNDFDVVYRGALSVSDSWTSEEVSSFIGYNRPESFPAKNVQVRFNEDGTIDLAAQVQTDFVLDELLGGSYTRSDVASYFPMLQILPEYVNVKVNFEGEVIQNQVRGIQANSANVMGVPLPSGLIQGRDVNNFLEQNLTAFTQNLNRSTGADIERMQVVDGELELEGTLPSSMEMIYR